MLYFSAMKSTIKEKLLYDSSLSEFFSWRTMFAPTKQRGVVEIDTYAERVCRRRRDWVSEFWQKYGCEHSEIKFALHNTHVTPHPPLSRSPFCPCLGDADRVCFANRSIPHWRRLAKCPDFSSAYKLPHARPAFIAGVQTMRARICSAFSCDMFARVVI